MPKARIQKCMHCFLLKSQVHYQAHLQYLGGFTERKQFVFVTEQWGHMSKRSNTGNLPEEYTVSFKIDNVINKLRLKRNLNVDHNAPVIFEDGSTISTAHVKVNYRFVQ